MKWFKKRYLWIVLLVLTYSLASNAYMTPILMYHHIDERAEEWKLSVSPESFRRQMEFLKAHQYKVLALEDYVGYLKSGKKPPKKSVVLTFDDGYDNNFINAFPVLKKMGFAATIFIQGDGINREGYMTDEDISILLDNGISIGSHTMHHGWLPELSGDLLALEIIDSKEFLESYFNTKITLFSYPGGGFDEKSRAMVIDAGYEAATATHPGPKYDDNDVYALKRIRISRTADNLFVFWLKISGFYTHFEEWRD